MDLHEQAIKFIEQLLSHYEKLPQTEDTQEILDYILETLKENQ